MNLYAVWLTYEFSERDTQLKINSNGTTFKIQEYEIANNQVNADLNGKIIVDFGD